MKKKLWWGLLMLLAYCSMQAQPQLTRIEYYLDYDPGYGQGVSVPFSPAATISNLSIPLNPATISSGVHVFNIRAQDANGNWSLKNNTLFYKPYITTGNNATVPNLTRIEYYLDQDPGYGQGTTVAFGGGTNASNVIIPLDPTPLAPGVHVFNVRAQDANGNWSLKNSTLFYKPYITTGNNATAPNLTRIEYYLDQDPGYGQATAVAFGGGNNVSNLVIPIDPTPLAPGVHIFNVRALDANGNWSLKNSTLFFKPYTQNSTGVNPLYNLARIEYYIDNDPGYGQATNVSFTSGTDVANLVISIDPASVSVGDHMFHIRAQDANGNWGLVNSYAFKTYAPAIASTALGLNGFNEDIIAEVPNDAVGSTTEDVDYSGNVFMSHAYNASGTSWLPDNGQINSYFRPGLQFQLAPYNGNNTLRVNGVQPDSLTLNTPLASEAFYLLGTSVAGGCSFDARVMFSDQSYQDFTNLHVPDWYTPGSMQEYAANGLGWCYKWNNNITNHETETRLFVLKLPVAAANQAKPVHHIVFTNTGGGKLHIMAISAASQCAGLPNPGNTLSSASTVCPDQDFTLSLQTPFFGAGSTYQWQSATDAAFTQNVELLGTFYTQTTHQQGAHYYRCGVSCSGGNMVYSQAVWVNIYAPAQVSVTSTAAAICSGNNVTLQANGAVSYVWLNAAGSGNTATVSPYTNATYTVVGTDDHGCTDSASVNVVVHQPPIVTAYNVTGCSSIPLPLSATPAGGIFSIPNPYTGPTTGYTYTYTDLNGCSASSSATVYTYTSLTFYQDADGDGYGNPQVSQVSCAQPAGYVLDATDCNDNDALQHPYQLWYFDHDHDQYGTGNWVQQCTRPVDGYAASELIATSGDCNDYDASIRPGAQYFQLSNSNAFPNVLISPLSGDNYTTFQFEVTYVDVNNQLPPPTYPRLILDYEGNGYYNDVNDRTLIMIPADANDNTTSDGKKYIISASSLPSGTNWKVHVESNAGGCITSLGPFDYPDVLQQPNLQIFANDISFSEAHPAVASQQTVYATVHNESDYAAVNFVVHLTNQYDTTIVYPDVLVPYLAAHNTYTVNWLITTPALPAWCPMKVDIDYTNVINESSELDNSAIRPFVNGNYNLPGGIHVYPYASPASLVAYPGASVNIGGFAAYYGTAVPLADSSVAGATVNFTVQETGASYAGYTNSWGNFVIGANAPLLPGIYHVNGTVTDFTLTGTFSTSFEIIAPCGLPDLSVEVNPSVITILQGTQLTGTVVVSNNGGSASPASYLHLSNNGGSSVLPDVNVPALLPGGSFTYTYYLTFSIPGSYNVCATIDPSNTVNECIEWNNNACNTINVLPALPDIAPYTSTVSSNWLCDISSVSFTVFNYGGVATGPFDCTIEQYFNGTLQQTYTQHINNISSVMSNANNISFSLPFNPTQEGHYAFTIRCDLPANAVNELDETNNVATYSMDLSACKPNFLLLGCEEFNVESPNTNYTPGSNITLKGKVVNYGNATYTGNLPVRWSLSNGIVYTDVLAVNLLPGGSLSLSHVIPAPAYALVNLTLTIDPDNLIDELNETDNSISNSMCWDFQPVGFCWGGTNFWDVVYQQYQTVYPSVGISNPYLYDADTLKVRFAVSGPGISGNIVLGDAVYYNAQQSCFCPYAVSLPSSFAFQQVGVYTFTITVDPDNQYAECDETNNSLVVHVTVTDLPDLRELSQFIAPSQLNPMPGQPISMNITYQNVGHADPNDVMSLKVYVDNTLLSTVYPLHGLLSGYDSTVAIPTTFASSLVGVHVIRAVIDADHQVNEYDESNNEATRSFIVGQSANLYFKSFRTLNLYPPLNTSVNIRGKIGNSGDLSCAADVKFYYVNNNLDTVYIGTKHVNVAAHDSANVIQPWLVVDNQTTIIGRIVNSSILEYTYDDNDTSFQLGEMNVVLSMQPACGAAAQGSLTANINGGTAPYSYFWNTGYVGETLHAGVGTYTVTVIDATGQHSTVTGEIISCPPVTLNLHVFLQGYYLGGGQMTPTIYNQGEPSLPTSVDTVTVNLCSTALGNPVIESYRGMLHTDGSLTAYFSPNVSGDSYYIELEHRNSIRTWSTNPVLMNTVTAYNFSDAASEAYGDNLIQVDPGIYAVYSADINQDDNVDLLDLSLLEYDIINYEYGYFATDINGDGNVDLLDAPMLENNLVNYIYSMRP